MLVVEKQKNEKKVVRKSVEAKVGRYGLDTRECIIQKMVEIINEKGMNDFRVDHLSKALKLSPGNITYHFPKKENLSYVVWVKFCTELKGVELLANSLMDIKQAFFIIRSISYLIFKYRGVVLDRGGDVALLCRDETSEHSFSLIAGQIINTIITHLQNNGYISNDSNIGPTIDFVKSSMVVNMRFWINKEYFVNKQAEGGNMEEKIFENSVGILYSLYPCLNKKGQKEFKSLYKKVIR